MRPELLRVQLEAILRTAKQGPCRILVPMVTDVAELRAVRALCDAALGAGASGPPIGVMIETPASALLADSLLADADFLSVGTNDLTQYTLAMDRAQPELARYCDALHPAVLRLIGGAAVAAASRGRTLSVCGGIASDPAAVPVLIGLGVRELSAIPSVIPAIKARVRALSIESCMALAHEAQGLESASAVRALLARWHSESGAVPEDAT
jgi:phosphoenolpyruvate-protein kinase (PTS system EI component)